MKPLIRGFDIPSHNQKSSQKNHTLPSLLMEDSQADKSLIYDTTVMFQTQYARNIMVLGVFLNIFWLWYFVKQFVDLLVCMCLLAGWPLDFGLRVYVDECNVCCSNKQEYVVMEHTSTICKIHNMIDKPKHLRYDFIHK
jgi:hypothetical protein